MTQKAFRHYDLSLPSCSRFTSGMLEVFNRAVGRPRHVPSVRPPSRSGDQVWGALSRLTGERRVFWRTAVEVARSEAGQPSKMSRYAEMTCQRATKLL